MAGGLQIGKKQQFLFICNEQWVREIEISSLWQGMSSGEIKCFGSGFCMDLFPAERQCFPCSNPRASILLREDHHVACTQRWLFQAPTCEAGFCYQVPLDRVCRCCESFAISWSQWHLAPWQAGFLLQRFGILLVFYQDPNTSSRIALANKIENYSQGLEYTPTSLLPFFCSPVLWVLAWLPVGS